MNERRSVRLDRNARLPETAATKMRRHRPDYWLIVLGALLVAIGLIVVYSISPALNEFRGGNFVLRQSAAIGLSILAFIITSRIPIETFRKYRWHLVAIAAVGTLIALLTPVVSEYPQHRWIRFGSFSLQSVEVLKFALLIVVSSFLASRVKEGAVNDFKKTLKPLAIGLTVVATIVVFVQSDLGSMGVLVAMLGAMVYMAGLHPRYLITMIVAVLLVTTLAVASTPYRRDRLATYLNPEQSCQTDQGYQACQALIAVGSGGIAGLGLGNSVQAYGYLPEAQNDSIFAIYAEKFGFLGSMVLLVLFMTLFSRMRLIIERAPDTYSQLLVTGILAWFSTQAIINIGAMIGLLPLKGITLPFVSYGGTSVLFVGAALGLVYQISHYTSFENRRKSKAALQKEQGRNNENSNDRRRIRGAYHPDLGRRS
ncbi:MAG: putative peptidoglycan glycosyltransferase FtsW [Candidatus Saccharimonadales bacterium]